MAKVHIDFEVNDSQIDKTLAKVRELKEYGDKQMRHELMLALIDGADKNFIMHPANAEYLQLAFTRIWRTVETGK